MAEHYSTAILPARPRSPKDKAFVEGAVGVASTWILAALRNRQFLSLTELNEAIHEKLEAFRIYGGMNIWQVRITNLARNLTFAMS